MQIGFYLRLLLEYVWKPSNTSVASTLPPLPPLNICVHGVSGDSLSSSSLQLALTLNTSHTITFIGNDAETKQAIFEGLTARSLGKFENSEDIPGLYDATFPKLETIVQEIQPDVIVCQGTSPACRDVTRKYNKTLVTVVENLDDVVASGLVHLPYITNSNKYGPITTESLSLSQRFQDAVVFPITEYFNEISQVRKLNKLRNRYDVPASYKLRDYSDSLVLATSFTGLEPAVPLPPYIHLVGPILHEGISQNSQITNETLAFLDTHLRTIFISQESELSTSTMEELIRGILITLEEETVDGVIWEVGKSGGRNIPSTILYHDQQVNTHQLLMDFNNKIRIVSSAPRTKIMNHPHTLLFVANSHLTKTQLALQTQTPILFLPLSEDNKRLVRKCVDFGVARVLSSIKAASLANLVYNMLHDKTILLSSQQMRLLAVSQYDHINKLISTHGYISKSNPSQGVQYLNPSKPAVSFIKSNQIDVYLIASLIGLSFLGIAVDIFIKYFQSLRYGVRFPRRDFCPPQLSTC